MASDTDHDSLFGDGGDLSDNDSLFGSYGQVDVPKDALEAELAAMLADDSEESHASLSMPSQYSMVSQPATQALGHSEAQPSLRALSMGTSCLTLPGATEVGTLPSPPVSCSAAPVRLAPVESNPTFTEFSLTLPSRPISQSSPPSRTPTSPDPLDVSLSRQEGHTSGTFVVSTQHLTHPSPAASTQASDEEAELEALMEWELLKDQDVNSTSPQFGDHEGLGLDQKLIPGNRYAHTNARRNMRPPRRIDLEESRAEILTPFLFFQNTAKMDQLFARLELKVAEGKKLSKALKNYLRNSPFNVLINGNTEANSSKGKESLVKTSLHILNAEGWGEQWFGMRCSTAATRKQFWPTDSTLVTINFAALLHKTIRTEKQVQRNQARKKKERWGSESVASVASSETGSRRASATPQPPGDGPALLDALVRNVTSNKQRIQQSPLEEQPITVEVPSDAELTYRVYVKDKTSGVDLSAPTIYQHSNQKIAHGAYAYLVSSFETAGYSPVVVIHTASSTRSINNAVDWDSAVREVYWWRSRGGVVEVDVLV